MTSGLSPKLIPVGGVLIAFGERDTGLAVLLTGVGGFGLGYAAPPGKVK